MTKHVHIPDRRFLRFKAIPKGYKRHTGKRCPVSDETYVDVAILTSQGIGIDGPIRAKMHDWNPDNHEKGLGAVVAYKVIEPGSR